MINTLFHVCGVLFFTYLSFKVRFSFTVIYFANARSNVAAGYQAVEQTHHIFYYCLSRVKTNLLTFVWKWEQIKLLASEQLTRLKTSDL